jgi:ribosomal protein S27E
MFTSLKKLSLVAVVLGSGLVVAGCQSPGGSNATTAGMAPKDAVTCSKCQVTWVKEPITPGGGKDWKVTGYTSRKSHECPDCRNEVQNFFTTGKFAHTCKTCGDTMEVCHVQ